VPPDALPDEEWEAMWMKRILRWIGWCLLALIVLIVAVFTVYRLRGPSSTQREALALMQKDYRPSHGINAFPLLWFMRYDVPADQLDVHMAVDVAAVRKRLDAGEFVTDYAIEAPPLAEPAIDKTALCEIRASGCLAMIAAHVDAVRPIIVTHPTSLARARAFEHADYYWNELPADYHSALLAFPSDVQRLWLSAFALQYVNGDHAGALTAVCNNLGAWRRMSRGTNSLIGVMLTTSHGDGTIPLFADMLAGLRADEAVPAECTAALQPVVAVDVDRCAPMAGEFAMTDSDVRKAAAEHAMQPWWDRALGWIFFEERQSEAWRAEDFSARCGDVAVERMLADRPVRGEPARPVMQRLECVSSLIGCVLADIAAPVYVDYDKRTLDFAAHLRLAATLLWLRDQSDGTPSKRFERRPESLRSAKHASGVDESRGTLYVDNLFGRREARFELQVAQAKTSVTATSGSVRPQP
jgi:hypothetical protein